MTTRTPQTIPEACDMIRAFAATQRTGPLRIIGGGTKGPLASSPAPTAQLCTQKLNRIIDLSPGDLTCTVEAGLTLRDLEAALAPHNLCLALDPPDYDGRATIGGVLASNDSGPLRAAYGTAREHVIGMSMILADAAFIKAGGRVVKNVAGYDLHRLFVGSRGTLGVIATVSFKLRPRAESRRLVELHPSSLDQAESWTAEILQGPTRPAILDWLQAPSPDQSEHAAQASGSTNRPSVSIVIGYEDAAESVEWQIQNTCKTYTAAQPLNATDSAAKYESLRQRAALTGPSPFRAALPPSALRDFIAAAPPDMPLHAHTTGAMIHGTIDHMTPSEFSNLKSQIAAQGGWLEWRDAGGTLQRARNVEPPVVALKRQLKQQLDPASIFPAL